MHEFLARYFLHFLVSGCFLTMVLLWCFAFLFFKICSSVRLCEVHDYQVNRRADSDATSNYDGQMHVMKNLSGACLINSFAPELLNDSVHCQNISWY